MTAVGTPCGPWGRGCGSASAFQDKELAGEEAAAHEIQLPEEEGAEEKEEEKKEEKKEEKEEEKEKKEEEKKEEKKEEKEEEKKEKEEEKEEKEEEKKEEKEEEKKEELKEDADAAKVSNLHLRSAFTPLLGAADLWLMWGRGCCPRARQSSWGLCLHAGVSRGSHAAP